MLVANKSKRQPELDALRGVFLLWMTLTHLPTHLSVYANQPFGFVSAAEGFVFLSAMLTGKLHSNMAREAAASELRYNLWVRARRVYGYHLLLLIFGFTVALWLGMHLHRPELNNWLAVYTLHPAVSAPALLTLIYCPALLDILPMYVLFLLLTPWVMRAAVRRGWPLVLGISAAVWLAAQFGFRAWLYAAISHAIGHEIPVAALGAFDLWAWQLLWIGGLWLGDIAVRRPELPRSLPRWAIASAIVVVIAGFLLRHGWPSAILWTGKLSVLEDKWRLAPVRILNFAAFALLISRAMPAVKRVLSWYPLAAIGISSIQVFTAHVICVLIALAFVPQAGAMLHGLQAALAIVLTYAVMFIVGMAATSHKLAQRRALKAESRGQSHVSTEARRL